MHDLDFFFDIEKHFDKYFIQEYKKWSVRKEKQQTKTKTKHYKGFMIAIILIQIPISDGFIKAIFKIWW